MSVVVPSNAFRLEIDKYRGSYHDPVSVAFHKEGGPDIVRDALQKAGIATGLWTLKILKPVRRSGFTPALTVQRADQQHRCVHLRIKPGDGTRVCVVASLFVDRSKPWSVDQVAERLQRLAGAAHEEDEGPDETGVDHDSALLLLIAVEDVIKTGINYGDRNSFFTAVVRQIGHEASNVQWEPVLNGALNAGYLSKKPQGYSITAEGYNLLNPPEEAAPKVTPAETIVANADRIALTLRALGRIGEIDKDKERLQATLEENISKLHAEHQKNLQKLENERLKVAEQIDPKLLADLAAASQQIVGVAQTPKGKLAS